ncbi:MAG TPA: glycosyltransferase, partial [Candidatus Saccharimonadales bacterium]|nr:glycosyltransferase [Candidatus Saccharimonadales bacterium]
MDDAGASAGPGPEPEEAPSDEHHDLYGAAYYDGYETLRMDGSGTAPVAYRWGESVWEEFFGNVAREVVARLHPSTALDAGCAIGFLVKSLRDLGVDAEGLDVSPWAINQVPADTRPYCRQGLVTDELSHDYDVITCIEVLEHLAPADAESAVGNLCRHGRVVLFSSTPAHFDEVTHVNVRPPDYWAGLFARHGFYRDFDFDAGFISPDAVLFRPVPHLGQVIRAYERQLWDTQRELRGLQAHREHLHAELQRLLGDRDQASAELRALLNTKTFRLSAGMRSLWARTRGNKPPTQGGAGSPPVAAPEYRDWVREFDTLSDEDRKRLGSRLSALTHRPTFSVLMPVFNPEAGHLRRAIESVLAQSYPEWELCIADDASTAGHVRPVLEEYRRRDGRIRVVYRPTNGHIVDASNSALELARGEFVALLDHDDELAAHALACLALELARQPTAAILYSDEDKIDEQGDRFEPYFKSNWNDELFLGQNYLSHLGAFRRKLVLAAGGFRRGFEGSQDYDLSLRVRELCGPDDIRHIPLVLYHWRAHRGSTASSDLAKPYARAASRQAVVDHLARTGRVGEVGSGLGGGITRVHWAIPTPIPRVRIILGGTNFEAQAHSIVVIQQLTDYSDYQIDRAAGRWP